VQTASSRHARQTGSLGTDVAENLPNHVAEEQKVDARRDASQNDESQLTLVVKDNIIFSNRRKYNFDTRKDTARFVPRSVTQIE